ncbi:unnamed protein product [Rotaria sp. Silwood2]|nr:unnamed protein product [Rotaria sp. Silwood2]CAF3190967.1 unnamed protein product [Rotaria sp. Silwood2]CAF4349668.1 unnamed protein product [Rotaria sp. Silwood2]CAF4512360.1 unnamed protein product [Rotaria sp. Silwood2]
MNRFPSNDAIIESLFRLRRIHDRHPPILQLNQYENSEYNVLNAYSSNEMFGSTEFYNYVHEQLRNDNKTPLTHMMPFIRRATSQINNNGPLYDCVVYRSMNLSNKDRNFFTSGKIFRFLGFTSTSTLREVARRFGDTLIEIRISAGCRQVRNITNISYFTAEQEWLFPPYSCFRVGGKDHDLIVLE